MAIDTLPAPAPASQAPAAPAPAPSAPPPSSPPPAAAPAFTPPSEPAREPSFTDRMNEGLAAMESAPSPAPASAAPLPGAVLVPGDPTAMAAQPAVPQVAAQPQPTQTDMAWALDLAKMAGVDPQAFNDAAGKFDGPGFVQAMVAEAKDSMTVRRELAEMKQRAPYYQAWMSGAVTPPVPQAPAAPAADKPAWEAPKYDPAWEHMITRDADGNLTVQQGVDPAIIGQRQKFYEHRAKTINDLATDPYKFMEPMIEARAAKVVESKLQAMQEEQRSAEIVRQNESWMTQMNPITGQKVWTPVGQEYASELKKIFDAAPGMPTVVANEYAKKAAYMNMEMRRQSGIGAAPPAAAPVAQPAAPQPAPAPPGLLMPWQPAAFTPPAPVVHQNAFTTMPASPLPADRLAMPDTTSEYRAWLRQAAAQSGIDV